VTAPLKVLQVGAFPFPSPQGSQVLLGGTARALASLGHEVRVACYHHGVGDDRGLTVHRAPCVPGYTRTRSGPDLVKPGLDLLLAQTVRRVVEAHVVDVVHAHNHEALLACALGLAGLSRRPALVYGEHTLLAEELATYFSVGARAWSLLGRGLDATLPLSADGAVALSTRGAVGLGARLRGPVEVIPPGIDPADFEGVQPRRAGPEKWLVFAGTPDRFQDAEVLVPAIRGLRGWRLLLVGAGWEPIAALNPDVVHVAGGWFEVRDWIAGADVAALPRRVCAGFPLKLLNYAALGLRTVVSAGSARGVPGEHIVSGAGTIEGRTAEFVDAVRTVAELPRLDGVTVQRDWSWHGRGLQLEAFYRRVLSVKAHTAARRNSVTSCTRDAY
jgi:hypothetical protein